MGVARLVVSVYEKDLYIIGAVCLSFCNEKVTSSLICSATVAGEIYIL